MQNKLYQLQQKVLHTPWFFRIVMLICIGGVGYGFFWYKDQLAQTPLGFWIFTPDCPGAVFLFLIWIFLWARKLPNETFRVIAVTALIKYGIWTVSVIGLLWVEWGIQSLDNVVLFLSHVGMMILGVVFAARMRIDRKAFWITSGWLILNDVADYYFGVHPWLPDYRRLPEIRLGTIILTGLIIMGMYVAYRQQARVQGRRDQEQMY